MAFSPHVINFPKFISAHLQEKLAQKGGVTFAL
jgi:hypothetical protein